MKNIKEFKEGDIVWYIDGYTRNIVCSEIVCVSLCEKPIGYNFIVTKQNLRKACQDGKQVGILPCRLFPSKEALLEDLEKNIEYDRDEYGRLVYNKTKEE